MPTYNDGLAALANAWAAAVAEAQKRRDIRAAEGRDLPPETRAQLEGTQVAVAAVLAPVGQTNARSMAELRAEIDARMAYFAGPPVGRVAGVIGAGYDQAARQRAGVGSPETSDPGSRPAETAEQAPSADQPSALRAVSGPVPGLPGGARPSDD